MKLKTFALALGVVSAGALLLPDGVLARGGGRDFHGANFHGANVRGANLNRANINRANVNRAAINNRVGDWRGNVGYGGWGGYGGYGWGAAGAAATAVGAAAAGATLYNYNNASCYQQQQVWNGSAYVLQTVRVC